VAIGVSAISATRRGQVNPFQLHPLLVAAVTHRALAAGLVNEDAPHGLGGGPEKMRPAVVVRISVADQPQPGFMHQGGGLQRLMGRFIGHARGRELAQLAIDQRQQFIGGLGIAVLDGLQNAGNVAQSATIIRFFGIAPEDWAIAPHSKFHANDFIVWAGKHFG
jgi:hypothetical protein